MRFLKKFKLFTESAAVPATTGNAPEPPGDSTDNINAAKPDDELVKKNDDVNKESLKMIQDNLTYYKQKKQKMDGIFNNKKIVDDVALNQALQKDVYNNEKDGKKRNPYLVSYESVWRLKREVDKISTAIDTDNGRKNDVQQQVNNLNDRINSINDATEKQKVTDQVTKSNSYLQTLTQTITANKKELSLSDKNYQKKRVDFDTLIKKETQKIQTLSKK